MSHSISAYREDVNRNALYKSLRLEEDDEGRMDRYEEYLRRTEVGSISRGAGNPLNQVIYLALGCMDEAYAGCSGNGVVLKFDRKQLVAAAEVLEKKSFEGMTREWNAFDDVMVALSGSGLRVVPGGAGSSGDVGPEIRFVSNCIAYLDETGAAEIEIHFC